MIDVEKEQLLSLTQAAKLRELRVDGRQPALCTLWRWVEAQRLESIKIAGKRVTSREAVLRMLARENPGAVPTVSPKARERELRKLEKDLEAAGV